MLKLDAHKFQKKTIRNSSLRSNLLIGTLLRSLPMEASQLKKITIKLMKFSSEKKKSFGHINCNVIKFCLHLNENINMIQNDYLSSIINLF